MKEYIALAMAAILSFASCRDFLTKDPVMKQSAELVLSDYNGLNKAVAGAYSPLADGTWYGAFFVLNSEMRVGNAMIPTNSEFTSGRMLVPYKMTYEPSSTEDLWSNAYYVISSVNAVIDRLNRDYDTYLTGTVTEADLDNLKGEALAIRALAHFDLLRLYGYTNRDSEREEYGVPLILTPQSPNDKPARATVSDSFKQIISDLKEADSLMDDDYARSGVTDVKAVVTKDVVRALLSRVYLYNREYQKCADYATVIIKSGRYALWTKEEYCSVWGKEVAGNGGEVIFEVYGKQSNEYDEYWEGPSHMTNPAGYADCAASTPLVSSFESGDVRGTTGIRGMDDGKAMFCTDKNLKSGNQMWTMKYFGKGDGNATSTPDVSNVVVLRLSEMYLNRAEAIANGASVSGTSAEKDVNAVRAARGASLLGSVGIDLILRERLLELNFEGHYWFDLARTGRGFTYEDSSIKKGLTPDSHLWAMPIPKIQTELDSNLKQNPGYND